MHGGADYLRRYDTWLAWFEEQGIEGVGFGWINLRRTDAERPEVRFEEWPYDVEQPIAPAIADWGHAVDDLRALDDDALAARHLVARADVRQETVGAPGAEDPETIVLRQQRGFRRARTADTVEAALVGACDGDLQRRRDPRRARRAARRSTPTRPRTTYLPVVRELVDEGFLVSTAEQSPRTRVARPASQRLRSRPSANGPTPCRAPTACLAVRAQGLEAGDPGGGERRATPVRRPSAAVSRRRGRCRAAGCRGTAAPRGESR